MPWIKVIPEHEAQGELKEVYRKLKEQRRGEKLIQERDASASGAPARSAPPSSRKSEASACLPTGGASASR